MSTLDDVVERLAPIRSALGAIDRSLMILPREDGAVSVSLMFGEDPAIKMPRSMEITSRAQLLGQLMAWGVVGKPFVTSSGETFIDPLGADLRAVLDDAGDVLP